VLCKYFLIVLVKNFQYYNNKKKKRKEKRKSTLNLVDAILHYIPSTLKLYNMVWVRSDHEFNSLFLEYF